MTKKVANSRMGRPPGSRNKVGAELREVCQDFELDAVATILDIMWTGETEAGRLAAAKEILDRARGKASQAIGVYQLPKPVTEMTPDELLAVTQGRGL